MKYLIPIFSFVMLLSTCTINSDEELAIDVLKCEYLVNPVGIDVQSPRFSWEFSARINNKMQSAYRILVSSSEDNYISRQGDIWDSGKVESGFSTNISYDGNPLNSFRQYYWGVQVWDENNQRSLWSHPGTFETAMLDPSDWKAQWIGDGKPSPLKEEDLYEVIPAPLFRKKFTLQRPVSKARLYISGLGYYEAYLNGEKVGDHVLDPGWTNYGKRILYEVYDITHHLQPGDNAIGIMLGNGWYNPLPLGLFRRFNLRKYLTVGSPKVMARIRIEYEDGETESWITDGSWKTSESHILKNSIYLGEYQDANRKIENWSKPLFEDHNWSAAIVVQGPGGKMKSQMAPPVKITGRIKPVSVHEPRAGVYVYDFGQNFAGWINFKVSTQKGRNIQFFYGELLNPDGTVNGMTTVAGHIKEIWNLSGGPGAPKTAYQIDNFVASGKVEEEFQQHFTFHAFRYVEISGLDYKPDLEDITGLRLSAELHRTGEIKTSNEDFNRIQEMVDWTFLSNVFSVQSDCPGREKFGYGADIVTSAEAYIYNYQMANFYRKTVNDFADDVRPNGGMPECAPYNGIDTKGFGEGTGPIGWQLAYPYVQKLLYSFYGDRTVIEENYELTKGMVDFLRSQAVDNLIYHGISDHVSIDPKPEALTSGAFYYHHVQLLVEFAGILGKTNDVEIYSSLLKDIRDAFIQKYLNPGTGRFDTLTTQITQVFALYYDLVPEEEKNKAFDVLIDEILDRHNGHLSTGIFGTKMLYDVLRRYNRNDIGYLITNQPDYPGYIYMLENGATTLWEHWDFQDQNSLNHPMFGSVSEWYFRSLLGINPGGDAIGFDKIIIRPYISENMDFAEGSYHSVKGVIKCSWQRQDNSIILRIKTPPNTNLYFSIPSRDPNLIRINGIPALANRDLEFIETRDGYCSFSTGNGSFEIQSEI